MQDSRESSPSTTPDTPTTAETPDGTATTAERYAVLWSFARPYLPVLITALFLSLLVSAMGLASPMVTKWVLDTLAEGGSLRNPIVLLVILLVIGSTVGFIQWIMLGRLAEDIVRDARSRMILRYLGARVFALLKRSPGELVTRVNSDTVLLNQAASTAVIGLINNTIMFFGSLILMAFLNLTLLGVTLAVVVLVFVAFTVLMPRIAKAEERAQASLAGLGSELEGTVRAIKTVKSSSAERRRYGSLMTHVNRSREHSLQSVRTTAIAWTIAGTAMELSVILVLAIGAWQITTGAITVSTLVAFLLYVWGLTGPLMEVTQNLTTLQSGLAAAGRIQQIEDIPVESEAMDIRVAPAHAVDLDAAEKSLSDALIHSPSPSTGAPALSFRNVTAGYSESEAPAVAGISLDIPARGHVAMVGTSGAGKTTVMSLAMRFLDPTDGEISLFGRPFSELSPAESRSAFAYVEQETPVIPGTIRENLLFTNPKASDADLNAIIERLGLAEKFASLEKGLDTPLTETNVSGGQRQRIALARALLAHPQILLLDEATAQVDGVTESTVQEVIAEEASQRAVVTIAHRLSTVIDADEIIVMDAGSIIARGTHEELLIAEPRYRDLVAALRIAT